MSNRLPDLGLFEADRVHTISELTGDGGEERAQSFPRLNSYPKYEYIEGTNSWGEPTCGPYHGSAHKVMINKTRALDAVESYIC